MHSSGCDTLQLCGQAYSVKRLPAGVVGWGCPTTPDVAMGKALQNLYTACMCRSSWKAAMPF